MDDSYSDTSDIADLCDVQPFTTFYEDANNLNFQKQNLNVGHININSIQNENRLDQLQQIMHSGSFSAFAVCETKLDIGNYLIRTSEPRPPVIFSILPREPAN